MLLVPLNVVSLNCVLFVIVVWWIGEIGASQPISQPLRTIYTVYAVGRVKQSLTIKFFIEYFPLSLSLCWIFLSFSLGVSVCVCNEWVCRRGFSMQVAVVFVVRFLVNFKAWLLFSLQLAAVRSSSSSVSVNATLSGVSFVFSSSSFCFWYFMGGLIHSTGWDWV